MVGQRDFGAKHNLKIEIVPLKNGATAHKALLAGELDSIEFSPGATILAGAHGADIKILGCDWPGVPHGLDGEIHHQQGRGSQGQDDCRGGTRLTAKSADQRHPRATQDSGSEVHFANLGGDLERFKAVIAGVADGGIVAAEFMAVAPQGCEDAGHGS